MQTTNETTRTPLDGLIQEDRFVGWVYQMDYEQALVVTHDAWRLRAGGVPLNCFLLAAAESTVPQARREILLLRVTGSAPTPECAETQARIEACKAKAAGRPGGTVEPFQFGGLGCRVLGTFYLKDGRLRLGSDIESYASGAQLEVYRPSGAALEMIVNYNSPERAAAAGEEARRLGLKGELPRFPIGTVRYASTHGLYGGEPPETAVFHLNAVDFLARRSAVLGMTRTGKSNTVKQLVSVVMRTGREHGLKIGQIIYDLNGEYANANQQDQGSIAEVYPQDTIRYRMIPTPGFELILNNFFKQISEGHNTLRGLIEGSKLARNADIEAFLSMDFDEPKKDDCGSDFEYQRQVTQHQLKLAAYQTMLARAGYEPRRDSKSPSR